MVYKRDYLFEQVGGMDPFEGIPVEDDDLDDSEEELPPPSPLVRSNASMNLSAPPSESIERSSGPIPVNVANMAKELRQLRRDNERLRKQLGKKPKTIERSKLSK